MSRGNKPPGKDMYWFAHGGAESDKNLLRNPADVDEDLHNSNSPTWNTLTERKGSPEVLLASPHTVVDGSGSSGPSSLEREDRLKAFDKRLAVEERKKQLWEAEQERNDAALKKRLEREAALEARRNAQRSNISFAFGSSVPRNVEILHANEEFENMSRSFTASGLSPKGDDIMSRSMTSAISPAPRGRRKNDLMPTVPYERNPTPRTATSSTRKRSVSMTRLDQLAQPRRHYVEANKANSTTSSGASSTLKDVKSPTRPLSSASEHSGGSGRVPGTVTRRVRSSPRKPRPISIAGTIPDLKPVNAKPFEVKLSPVRRSYTPSKRVTDTSETKKTGVSSVKSSTPKSVEKSKPALRPTTAPKPTTPKSTTPKPIIYKSKPSESKHPASTSEAPNAPKRAMKKKVHTVSLPPAETKEKTGVEKLSESPSPPLDNDPIAENDKNNAKRIISEEEAKAALAEKRRLAREQAEREAELERQRQEELRREEEERLRQEEEEHRKMEEEQMRLLEEHRRQEEEKLRKAIEDQEHKEEEERAKRDEEIRLKAEQEKKAKEEAEKQRLELEEKLRKEEEERAERKKRLEKIMSRTRGKSSGTSPSGSVSGSEQLDSGENAHEGFSSGANSLDSNETGELPSEPVSIDDNLTKAEISSTGDSMENNHTYEIGSENESLNSNDLMMPMNETASQDNSLVIIPDKTEQKEVLIAAVDTSSTAISAEIKDEIVEPALSPSYTQKELFSVPSPLDSQVPNAALPESVEVLPIESHSLQNEDEDAGSLSFDNSVPEDVQVENKELENQVLQSQQSLENEQLFIQSELQEQVAAIDIRENDMLKDSEFSKVDESHQNGVESELNMPSNENTYFEVSFENSNQDAVLLSQPNTVTEDHSHFENVSAIPSGDIDLGYPIETELSDINRSSISSDIKLPDPIYETSDDGSVSSEKQLPDFKSTGNQEEFGYSKNAAVMDDVFSEQAAPLNTELNQQNPFGEDAYLGQPNPFPGADDNQRSGLDNLNQFEPHFGETNKYDMSGSMFEEKETFILPDVLEQPHEVDSGNVLLSGYSEVVEQGERNKETQQLNTDAFESQFSNFTNMESDQVNPFSQELKDVDGFVNNFSDGEMRVHERYDMYSENGNMFSAPPPTIGSTEVFQSEKSDLGSAGDNPFVGKSVADTSIFHDLVTQGGDSNEVQQHSATQSEQVVNFEEQLSAGGDFSSESEKPSGVTFIKDDGSGACVGIISSVDHDNVSNDFPKQNLRSEHFKNNFECASMTDSEDSSLDSNLSQVMTVESEQDTIGGLNHIENSILESNSSNLVSGNGERHDNPFAAEHIYNGSISKSNGSSFAASEVYSNGHGLESSKQEQVDELHDYLQLDGNDISSVDHSKNNMYENVDAIEYSKVSSDPFLAKGNSKQISGNPFLLQDDQKQVLMTPDFLN